MPILTETDIVNRALAEIGERLFDSYANDETERGRIIRAVYPRVVSDVLDEFPWQEFLREGVLVRDGAGEESPAKYKLPEDFRRMHRGPDDWHLEGRRAVTQNRGELIPIVYLADPPSPHLWSTYFARCVVELLSARLIAAIKSDLQGSAVAVQVYKRGTLLEAKRQCTARDAPPSYRPEGFRYRAVGRY